MTNAIPAAASREPGSMSGDMDAGPAGKRRFSLRMVLAAGFISMVLLTLVAGAVSVVGQLRSAAAVKQLITVDGQIAGLSGSSHAAMVRTRRAEKDFLLAQVDVGFDEARSRYVTVVRTNTAAIRDSLALVRKLSADQTLVGRTQAIEQAVARYESEFMRVVDMYATLGSAWGGLAVQIQRKRAELEEELRSRRLERLMGELANLRESEKDFVVYGLEKNADAFVARVDRFAALVADAVTADSDRQALVGLIAAYTTSFLRYVDIARRIDVEEQTYKKTGAIAESALAGLNADAVTRIIKQHAEVDRLLHTTSRTVIVASIVAALLGLAVAAFLSGHLMRPVAQCVSFARNLTAGDWSIRVTPRGPAEFAVLGAALNRMADRLQESRVALERRAAELAESNHVLQEEVATRRRTEEQLVRTQKMEALGQLTGGLAHDFNNLLGVILAKVERLEEDVGPEDTEKLELIHSAAAAVFRGADLTRSLLAFARRQPLRPQMVDINACARDLSSFVGRTLGEQIEKKLTVGEGVWPVFADRAQIDSAILNACVNARDAMPSGGVLTIETSNVSLTETYAARHQDVEPGDYVLIAISDTGTGMSPEVMARAFEPFFTTKEPGKGTGLGLSMIFGFVKQSRGHAALESEVGRGTTVKIYLPRHVETASVTAVGTQLDAEASRGTETILVVDDYDDLRQTTVTHLAQLGYTTIQASNAAPALDIIRSGVRIDLLLSDVVMGGAMSGYELARTATQLCPGLKVLLMSGFPDVAELEDADRTAAANVLRKPFSKRELASRVRDLLDEPIASAKVAAAAA